MATVLKGNVGTLVLQFDSVDYTAQVGRIELKSEDADNDFTTFADAAAGGKRQFYIEIEAVQSLDSDSLWTYLWENTGDVVAYSFAPTGSPTTAAHFTGNIRIGAKPDVGGEAGSTWTFEYRLDCEETPTLVPAV